MPSRERPDGFTLVEALLAVVIIGIISTIALVNYTGMRQRGFEREAGAYLQLLRQASLAYYQRWNLYPTSINNLRPAPNAPPVIQIPEQTNRLSRWAYCYASTDRAQWSLPRALFKNLDNSVQGSYREIVQNGTMTDFSTGASGAWLADEP